MGVRLHAEECAHANRFLEQLELHQIKADKFFKSHKRDGRAFVNMGQLEETGRHGWAV